ncbi:MAG: OmpA family protein [Verrucomicrobiota bacterium]
MIRFKFCAVMVLGLALTVVLSTGCRHKKPALTYIPGQTRAITNDFTGTPAEPTMPVDTGREKAQGTDLGPMTGGPKEGTSVNIPLADRRKRENLAEDREALKAYTLYFDFDRAAVKASERSKAEKVAAALKAKPEASVEIEGHCDERGTEEYNRSLGERRALAVREYLINLGIASDRVFTVSFGKDRPAVPSHNDAAYAKNRRGEFVLLTPKQ